MVSKVIVILGMDKSGTNLLSRILSKHFKLKNNISINLITFSKEKKKFQKHIMIFSKIQSSKKLIKIF
jgi:hypothetical protein